MLADLTGLSNQDLIDLRNDQISKKSQARSDLSLYENDLKAKRKANKDIQDRLSILQRVKTRELRNEAVSFTKYKQVKEAIQDTLHLIDGLRPPTLKLEEDIQAIQNRIAEIEVNIRLLDKEIKGRAKLIKIEDYDDGFRGTQEDSP